METLMTKRKALFLVSILTVLALSVPLGAQQKDGPEPPQEKTVSKIFELKYADVTSVAGVINVFGAQVHVNSGLKIIGVNGTASTVEAIGEAIKKLDVPRPPSKSIDFTAYVLVASDRPIRGEEIPSELHAVINQLRAALAYKEYRLLSTVLLRARDGAGANLRGVTPAADAESPPANFNFAIDRAVISPENKENVIRIDQLGFELEVPPSQKQAQSGRGGARGVIKTSVDLKEGQKIVIGKTTFDSPENALILVLMAKVVG
jgi:hypothetical protein